MDCKYILIDLFHSSNTIKYNDYFTANISYFSVYYVHLLRFFNTCMCSLITFIVVLSLFLIIFRSSFSYLNLFLRYCTALHDVKLAKYQRFAI